MKKIIQLLCIVIIIVVAGCNEENTKNEINPLALLSLFFTNQSLIGNSSLTVTATYTGTAKTELEASGKIYVYLYRTLGARTRDPKPLYRGSTNSAVAIGTPATITLNRIRDGEYYMLVFYDFHGGDNPDNQTDRYTLYNDTGYTSGAQKVIVSGNTVIGDVISFGDTYKLDTESFYATGSTYTLTVKATYTGVESADPTATKYMYVYLYGALGTDTQNPIRTGTSSTPVVSGNEQTITVNNVPPGKYYALVFYDSSFGTAVDSAGDPYIFFTATPYPGNATKFVMNGDLTLPSISFVDTNTLQADNAYMTPASTYTLTVNAAYTGTLHTPDPTTSIHVYLYSLLGTGTRNSYLPIYTGVSSAVTSTDPYAITINNVIPGNYYVLVFYNYSHTDTSANNDSKDDRYRLYDNVVPAGTRCRGEADQLTISGPTDLSNISIDNTIYLRSSAAYDNAGCP